MDRKEVIELVKRSIPKDAQLVVAVVRVGSKAYNLETKTSDEDYRCIYRQTNKDILSGRYTSNIQVTDDIQAFELREFLRQLHKGSFTATEVLFVEPVNNFVYSFYPDFKELMENRYQLIGETLIASMDGYIKSNLNRKQERGFIRPKAEYHIYRLAYTVVKFVEEGFLSFSIREDEAIENLKRIKLGEDTPELRKFKEKIYQEYLKTLPAVKGKLVQSMTLEQIQQLEYEMRISI